MQRIAVPFRGVDINVRRGMKGAVMWGDGTGRTPEEKEWAEQKRKMAVRKIHIMSLDYLRYLETMASGELNLTKLNLGLSAKYFFGNRGCVDWFMDAGIPLTRRGEILKLTPQGAADILRGKSGAGYVER